MRSTMEMDTSTAIRLRKLADARRITIEELLALHMPVLSGEEGGRAFEEWVSGFPQNMALLSNEAVSRASIYRDR